MAKRWADVRIHELGETLELRNGTSQTDQIRFLQWASKSSQFAKPIVRELQLPGELLHRVTVQLNNPSMSNMPITGCGRAKELPVALIKAYAETVERVVALEAQSELALTSTHSVYWDGSSFRLNQGQASSMPPAKIRTTNGWAVHFNIASAIQNAISEAIERHVLLTSYLKFGWDGFLTSAPVQWNGLEMRSFASKLTFCGHQGGLVATKVPNHVGYTFGYFCERSNTFATSRRWFHAMMEAFEPAKYYQLQAIETLREKYFTENDPMERSQLHYVLNSPVFSGTNAESTEDLINIERPSSLPIANLVVLNIAEKWGLDFDLYAAFVYGQSLVPLFFKETLDPAAEEYVRAIMRLYNLRDIPDVHPIL